MLFNRFLFSLTISLICLFSPSIIDQKIHEDVGYKNEDSFIINTDEYGPFFKTDKDITFKINVKSNYDGVIFERYRCGPLDHYTYSKSLTSHKVSNGQIYQISFNLPYKSYLTENGLRNAIIFLTEDSEIIQEFSFVVYPDSRVLKSSYNLNDDAPLCINGGGTIFKYEDNVFRTFEEIITFYKINDFFLIDNYYRLDLKDFYFDYYFHNGFTYTNAFLSFSAKDFPRGNLPIEDGKIKIPLVLKCENNRVFVSFSENLYVNPKTMLMSSMPDEGYVKTRYFYLPINEKDLVDKIDFVFEINGIGIRKINASWHQIFLSNVGILGPCSTSEYCVVGGINS